MLVSRMLRRLQNLTLHALFFGVQLLLCAPALFYTTLPHALKFSIHNRIAFLAMNSVFRGNLMMSMHWHTVLQQLTSFGKSKFQQQKCIAHSTNPHLQLTVAPTETPTATVPFEPIPFQYLQSLHNAIVKVGVIPCPTLYVRYISEGRKIS